MIKKLNEQLKRIPEKSVVLVLLPSKHYEEINMHLLDYLIDKRGGKGTYITVNRTHKNMIELLEKNKINHSRLHFLDCISGKNEKTENCTFIHSPRDLTGMGIALTNLIKKKDHEFVFLDSLNTLAFYNSADLVIRFSHDLINKIRDYDLNGIMLGLHEDTDKKIKTVLGQFCDNVIDLTS